jgi:hypothetical protein
MKHLLYGGIGGGAGYLVCLGVGFLIAALVGVPDGAQIGPGLQPWNLPGTILGAMTWGAIMWYTLKKR